MRQNRTTGGVPLGVGLLVACAVATGYTYADHAPLIPLLTASLQVSPFEAGLFSTASTADLRLARLGRSLQSAQRTPGAWRRRMLVALGSSVAALVAIVGVLMFIRGGG